MAQIFHPSTNTISKVSIFGAVFFVAGLLWLVLTLARSDFVTEVNVPHEQAIPFSHKHHVAGLGIDCRYCHTTVEYSSFAGMPSTETCISCHQQIWADADMLEPVRESFRTGRSLVWRRVYDLPGFVYFNHSIHVKMGVGCAVCHGPVDQMPLMRLANPLTMEWCLNCHRSPERYVRPREAVFDMTYAPPSDQFALGSRLVEEYNIRRLTDCYTCHR